MSAEEEIEWLGLRNQEPAMPRWRKELMTSYQYRQLHTYEPAAEGLLPEEKEQLMSKLIDTSNKGNRWVYPEGLEMVDLWSTVVALDKSDKPDSLKPLPRMTDALSSGDIDEQHTWGIDCFCRRNIEIVLSKGRGGFAMTLPQIRWFIEFVLLRACNAAQPIEEGWDLARNIRRLIANMREKLSEEEQANDEVVVLTTSQNNAKDATNTPLPNAFLVELDEIGAVATVTTTSRTGPESTKLGSPKKGKQDATPARSTKKSKSGSPEPISAPDDVRPPLTEELVHRRIKVWWEGDQHWYHGRIINFREPAEFLVLYDDTQTIWENLGKEKFKLIGSAEQKSTYDDSLTKEQIILACEILVEQYAKRGSRDFAVHSKGIGVVTKVPIEPGRLIQKYTGLLYPCWLWEQKEAKEDDERLVTKRDTGEVMLPDFWNMRLELPKDEDDQGIDLLHVDAKTAGNFASRMSHSCRPNCGTMTAVIDGHYCIGMRSLRKIEVGEELTIDYNCVTDSLDEYRAAICLCGSHDCRGSFLYITGATHQMQIVDRSHAPLHRVAMLFAACYDTGELERAFGSGFTESWPRWVSQAERTAAVTTVVAKPVRGKKKGGSRNSGVSTRNSSASPENDGSMEGAEDSLFKDDPLVKQALQERGFGTRALVSLPPWALRFAAHIVEFIDCEEFERSRLEYVQKVQEAEKKRTDSVAAGKSDSAATYDSDEFWRIAKLESKGVADQRVTNLVIALDKARHHMCERLSTNAIERPGEDSSMHSERTSLRERWWVSDRCLARWLGDDAADFPDSYPAIVTHVYVDQQELRVVYDNDEEINRIPFALARRPKVTEVESNFTGCDVMYHQPPFQVLDEDAVLDFLWRNAASSVAVRLVKSLVEACNREIPLWQSSVDAKSRLTYWWNFETRAVQHMRPSPTELCKKTKFVPKVVGLLEQMLVDKKPTTGEAARKAICAMRDLILKIPVPTSDRILEDMHQKAADLLTLYSHTRNFFTLYEPESESTNSHAVINALTSWIGQGVESRLPDITEMVGTALLPPIERAYDPNCGLGYCGPMRSSLLSHLKQNDFRDWPKNVVSMFPNASDLPPQPPDIETQWPHPVPPVRLFGSPALDSAIFDHLDYTKACAVSRESGKKQGAESRETLTFKDERGSKNMAMVAQMLREKKRDPTKFDTDDLAKVTPPPLPEPVSAMWVQCESPTCGKWRKLPYGFDAKQLPSPFSCEDLNPHIDPYHGRCDADEEQETGVVVVNDKPDLNPDALRAGDLIDVFDKSVSEWKIAYVLETTESAIKLKYVDAATQVRIEWMEKRPEPAYALAFPAIALLHTYTVPTNLKKVKKSVPYTELVPDADPEVAKCLQQLVAKVERKFLPRSSTKKMTPSLLSKSGDAKVRRPRQVHTEQIDKLQATQFVPDIDVAQRSALSSFLIRERLVDPAVPFVTVLARWSVMDQAQRRVWGGKSAPKGFALVPKTNHSFAGPSLLTNKHTQATTLTVRSQLDATTRTFLGGVSVPSVGMPLETAYGKGMVTEVDAKSVIITLVWGAKLYVPVKTFRAEAPLFSACPVFGGRNPMGRVPTSSPLRGKLDNVQDDDEPTSSRKRKKAKRQKRLGDMMDVEVVAEPEIPFDFSSPDWIALESRIDEWRLRWMHARVGGANENPFVLDGVEQGKKKAARLEAAIEAKDDDIKHNGSPGNKPLDESAKIESVETVAILPKNLFTIGDGEKANDPQVTSAQPPSTPSSTVEGSKEVVAEDKSATSPFPIGSPSMPAFEMALVPPPPPSTKKPGAKKAESARSKPRKKAAAVVWTSSSSQPTDGSGVGFGGPVSPGQFGVSSPSLGMYGNAWTPMMGLAATAAGAASVPVVLSSSSPPPPPPKHNPQQMLPSTTKASPAPHPTSSAGSALPVRGYITSMAAGKLDFSGFTTAPGIVTRSPQYEPMDRAGGVGNTMMPYDNQRRLDSSPVRMQHPGANYGMRPHSPVRPTSMMGGGGGMPPPMQLQPLFQPLFGEQLAEMAHPYRTHAQLTANQQQQQQQHHVQQHEAAQRMAGALPNSGVGAQGGTGLYLPFGQGGGGGVRGFDNSMPPR